MEMQDDFLRRRSFVGGRGSEESATQRDLENLGHLAAIAPFASSVITWNRSNVLAAGAGAD
jgi:hypothetical protein